MTKREVINLTGKPIQRGKMRAFFDRAERKIFVTDLILHNPNFVELEGL
jgi:hypothetical protein